MSKIGFTTWLLQQSNRDDLVGDFARDARTLNDRPHGKSGVQKWHTYFSERMLTPQHVRNALDQAEREYQQFLRDRV